MTRTSSENLWSWRLAVLAPAVLLLACPPPSTDDDVVDDVVPEVQVSCSDDGVPLDLSCPQLPNTTAVGQWVDATGATLDPQPSNGQGDAGAYLDFDLWAWNSFVAMSWPALDPADNNDRRGFPDTTATFAGAAGDATTVWETYKEKREVFLYDYLNDQPSSETPQPWNSARSTTQRSRRMNASSASSFSRSGTSWS